ncbi:MAG: pantoate--beta-alanine ligase, partial [Parvularculaceae bacterium]
MVAPHSFKSLEVIHTLAEMRQLIAAWRRKGERIALVPTMGALHDGHLSLLEIAKANADRVVASIFLNPTQFAANEDLSTYPRREQEDLERLSKVPCDAAYLPSTAAMYP